MMGYFGNAYYGGMMGGAGILMFLFLTVTLVDLILFGMWLWKQVKR